MGDPVCGCAASRERDPTTPAPSCPSGRHGGRGCGPVWTEVAETAVGTTVCDHIARQQAPLSRQSAVAQQQAQGRQGRRRCAAHDVCSSMKPTENKNDTKKGYTRAVRRKAHCCHTTQGGARVCARGRTRALGPVCSAREGVLRRIPGRAWRAAPGDALSHVLARCAGGGSDRPNRLAVSLLGRSQGRVGAGARGKEA